MTSTGTTAAASESESESAEWTVSEDLMVGGVQAGDGERETLLSTIAQQRGFLRHTVQGITEEQARTRTTVSELTLGGLIKHVTATEAQWTRFIVEGPAAMAWDEASVAEWGADFRMTDDETVESLLTRYAEVAARTEQTVRGLADLDLAHPLPEAPWFTPGAVWSARRVLLHIIAETAQHSGHADILRESLDGQKTMG
ncbi:MAG TPA: DinB family protein [Pseudonocardiaceae bacterium]